MLQPFFQSCQDRIFGYKTNYYRTLVGNYRVKTDSIAGTTWVELTPEEFTERYAV